MVTLASDQLRLRQPTEHDIDAVFTINSDIRTYSHRPELVMRQRQEAADLVHARQENWAADGIGYFVVTKLDDEPIGFCGLRRTSHNGEPCHILYYRFSPESQGFGYARETTQAAIAWAEHGGPSLPMLAIIDPANTASIRLAERLGFVRDAAGNTAEEHFYRRTT